MQLANNLFHLDCIKVLVLIIKIGNLFELRVIALQNNGFFQFFSLCYQRIHLFLVFCQWFINLLSLLRFAFEALLELFVAHFQICKNLFESVKFWGDFQKLVTFLFDNWHDLIRQLFNIIFQSIFCAFYHAQKYFLLLHLLLVFRKISHWK